MKRTPVLDALVLDHLRELVRVLIALMKLLEIMRRHGDLERRVEALESAFGGLAPFIDSSLRPDLEGSGLSAEEDLARMRDEMEQQTQSDKRLLDSPTHRR